MRTWRRASSIVIVAASVAVLAGCGGSTPGPALPAPATGAARTSTSLTAEEVSNLLDLGLIRLADLGEGWAENPNAKAGFEINSLEDIVAEPTCGELLEPFKLFKGAETKRSPIFQNADRVAANSATLLDSPQTAGKLISALNSIDPNECLTKVYQKALEQQLPSIVDDGSTLSSVRVRRTSLKDVGESRSVLEVTLDLKKDTTSRTLIFSRVAVQTGAVVQEFSLRSEGSAMNAETIVKPPVARIRQCLTKGQCTA